MPVPPATTFDHSRSNHMGTRREVPKNLVMLGTLPLGMGLDVTDSIESCRLPTYVCVRNFVTVGQTVRT